MKIAVFYENIKESATAKNIPIKDALTTLNKAGMEMLYISYPSIKSDWEMLKPILDELNIAIEGVYAFCDFTGNMPAFFPKITYDEVIDAAAMVEADNVLLVPGFVGEACSDIDVVKDMIVEGMTKAVTYGTDKGIKVSMEDFDGLEAPYCSVAGLKEFMDRIPGLYCSFDTGNFVMYHEDEYEAVKLFVDKLCTMHLKDRSDVPVYPKDKGKACADGVNVYPSAVGYGTMQIDKILNYVKEQGYKGNVIVELFDADPEYALESIEKSVKWLVENHRSTQN